MKKIAKIFAYTFIGIIICITIIFGFIKFNKERIVKSLAQELSNELNTTVTAQNLEMTFFHEFPKFSLTLVDVEILGDKYAQYKTALFRAKRIYLQSDLIELFNGNINVNSFKLEDANIIVFKTRGGYTNNCLKGLLERQKLEKKKKSKTQLSFHYIEFTNVSIQITDSIKESSFSGKFINFETSLEREKQYERIIAKGNVYFNSLIFNESASGFLNNQFTYVNWDLTYNIENKSLTLEPLSSLKIGESNFELSGILLLGKEINLTIKNTAISHSLAMAILNKKICQALSKYKYSGAIDASVNIKQSIDTVGLQPIVNVKGFAKNIDVYMKLVEFNKVNFTAYFTNQFDKNIRPCDENSRITFIPISAFVEGLPAKGKMFVHNMKEPFINLDITSNFDVKDAQDLVNSSTLLLQEGTVDITLKYQGLTNDLLNDKTYELNAKVDGSVKIKNAEVAYLKTNYSFKKINLDATFNNSDITLHNLNLLVNNNVVNAKGLVSKLMPFIFAPHQKILGKINVSSPEINLTPFIAKNSLIKKTRGNTSKNTNQKKSNRVANVIDKMIQLVELDLQLNADKILYKNFKATNAKGLFSIHNDALYAKKFSFNCSGGHFLTDSKLSKKNKLTSIVKIDNADAQLLFKSFDNFNQEGITSDNIEGKLSALVSFNCNVDKKMKILSSSMNGELDATFKEGKLNDCFTLGNVGKLLLNENNINHIEFEEIQSHGTLNGYDLQIEKIDVVSSYLSFSIEGVYSFKGETDLSIAVPVANVKKRNKNKYKVSIDQLKNNSGANIYLRAKSDRNGKLSVKYDLFKKFR